MTLGPKPLVDITQPSQGRVAFSLPYDEAEILLRAIGYINSGSLDREAPTLAKVGKELIDEFGRSTPTEARKYNLVQRNSIVGSQFYIEEYATTNGTEE